MKQRLFVITLLLLGASIGVGYFAVNYTSTVGYAVSKSDDSVWIISSDSWSEAREIHESAEIPGGLVLINLKEETVNEIKIGQEVSAYHSKRINASAPSDVDPLFVRTITN